MNPVSVSILVTDDGRTIVNREHDDGTVETVESTNPSDARHARYQIEQARYAMRDR